MGSHEEFRRRPSQDGSALPVMAALQGRSRAAGRAGNPATCRARSRDQEWAVLRGEATPPGPGAPGVGQRPGPGTRRALRRRPAGRPRGACSSQRPLRVPGRAGEGAHPPPAPGAVLRYLRPSPAVQSRGSRSHRSRGLALLRHARSLPPAPAARGFALSAGSRCPAMPSNKSVSDAPIVQFTNCRILRDHQLQREDLWVREGKILNPEKLFFDEKGSADVQLDCKDSIIAPGFIDVQINGGFGVDFSLATDDFKSGIDLVSQKILSHGVTSFCPTLVTSPPSVYHQVLPQISVRNGGAHGAGILGAHLEGPFISKEKKGAHPEHCLRTFEAGAFQDLLATYGSLDCVQIVTLAPEMRRSSEVIRELTKRGICVSLGHSVANLSQAEEAVQHGATFITHLFNAMLPFHHRDPGIVGLLTSDKIPAGRRVFYGMISDGIHTNPAALRIAHRAHPKGLVLVTDAIAGMGLAPGRHTLGQQVVEIDGLNTYIAGTKTLSGSVATMDTCVRHFQEATGCSVETALEAASLHPAQLLGIEHKKGTLHYDSDADFLMLNDSLYVQATYIAGEEVWRQDVSGM
ncbi:N-acetylglucosamine-6-phosphate deacetylase [Motacilla alba alba]|uniref:N-acetylglucosamine-6-phosphate deacetylase n=1 Tax=Motacilla alba alba TaxID=1094192 RepID=UPI0018D5427B|nr:N-acetylglucosamine-6-phosphate deacetylase [Motacilla alba alba]